ncbi:DUF4247 domain-containing protein [Paenibacillus cymbidii]|uniref:DUF4247 domain-containing protein n=1 Tax=Paenibacillus cymbidii TaxID=1639034 RepID=UPI0010822CE5|nr:DUF4247 domain-containing protein [Paenibacillus cymbidii]
MDRFRKYSGWLIMFGLVAFAIIVFFAFTGSGNASGYMKDHYPLVDVQGAGKENAKVYAVSGKTVPVVANEIAAEETPKEKSKENEDRMFLLYDDKVINVQKDPANEGGTLVEIDSVSYAKSHYDSSFLNGYLTASLVNTLLGSLGDALSGSSGSGTGYGGYNTTDAPRNTQATTPPKAKDTPSTSDRTGTFKSKDAADSGTAAVPPATGSSGSTSTSTSKPGTSSGSSTGSSGTFTTNKSGSTSSSGSSKSSSSSSSSVRKNDGSSVKKPATATKPSTSSRSGSFTKRK